MIRKALSLMAILLLTACRQEMPRAGTPLEQIRIAPDGRGFVLWPSGKPFHPWGNNYGNHGRLIEDYWDKEWPVVEEDFLEMKRMGANVVRVHLQFGKFMRGPDQWNEPALARLSRLLRLAEQTGLYLDLTGLACYRPADVPAWYDKLSEAQRWKAQAAFWRGIARACAASRAVFCYDLINEPVIATKKRKRGEWYAGNLGGLNFLQFLNLDPAGRTLNQIATNWFNTMKQAIRMQDSDHFITVGLLPFSPGPDVLRQSDFVSVHIYPEAGKVAQSMDALRQFAVGKPVVIEETFPLSCSVDDLKKFLLDSRPYACGWIGHYNGETIGQLDALRASGKISTAQSMWLAWLKLFVELGPVMAQATAQSPPN